MAKRSRKSKTAGLPPGTLVHTGPHKTLQSKVTLIDYDEQGIRQEILTNLDRCVALKALPSVTWINVDGVHDIALLEQLGTCFDLHPLVMEDILHTEQRPKIEDYGNYIYIVLKMLRFNDESHDIESEQVSLVLGENFVLSFQEKEGDVFNAVRERIKSGKGQIRKSGPDYLVYTLMDSIVDHYFLAMEKLGDYVELLEEKIVNDPSPSTLQELHNLRRQAIFLRKAVWPLREVLSMLEREASPLFKKEMAIYLRDLYDHTIRVIDSVETYRDLITGMLDIYMSSINNRINQVMKVLTVITTIFMPLTLISGIYGMNFKHMPELEWHWAYPAVLLAMLGIAVSMLVLFRWKKWL
jgi:magnesium transporter